MENKIGTEMFDEINEDFEIKFKKSNTVNGKTTFSLFKKANEKKIRFTEEVEKAEKELAKIESAIFTIDKLSNIINIEDTMDDLREKRNNLDSFIFQCRSLIKSLTNENVMVREKTLKSLRDFRTRVTSDEFFKTLNKEQRNFILRM